MWTTLAAAVRMMTCSCLHPTSQPHPTQLRTVPVPAARTTYTQAGTPPPAHPHPSSSDPTALLAPPALPYEHWLPVRTCSPLRDLMTPPQSSTPPHAPAHCQYRAVGWSPTLLSTNPGPVSPSAQLDEHQLCLPLSHISTWPRGAMLSLPRACKGLPDRPPYLRGMPHPGRVRHQRYTWTPHSLVYQLDMDMVWCLPQPPHRGHHCQQAAVPAHTWTHHAPL